jgi:hypothetical protein
MELQNLFGRDIDYITYDGMKITGKVFGEYVASRHSDQAKHIWNFMEYKYFFRNKKGEFPLFPEFFEIKKGRIIETKVFS